MAMHLLRTCTLGSTGVLLSVDIAAWALIGVPRGIHSFPCLPEMGTCMPEPNGALHRFEKSIAVANLIHLHTEAIKSRIKSAFDCFRKLFHGNRAQSF